MGRPSLNRNVDCRIYNGFLALMKEILDEWGLLVVKVDPESFLAHSSGDWARFQTQCAPMCRERRIFHTKTGRYGLGPACMQAETLRLFSLEAKRRTS
jgi:hypothetical protein